ncbi:hypothetical protein C8Q77DRAFT_1072770 [Trametes polyzona]|nr:hypothetical protein C8Q77DRAFT_1072770 [Trametes polyzona]
MASLYPHVPGRLTYVPRDDPGRADYILDYHYGLGHHEIYRTLPPSVRADSAYEIRNVRSPWDPDTPVLARFLEDTTMVEDDGQIYSGNAILIFEENRPEGLAPDGRPPSRCDSSPDALPPSQHLTYPLSEAEPTPDVRANHAHIGALVLEPPPVSFTLSPALPPTVDPRLTKPQTPLPPFDTIRTVHEDFGVRLAALAHEACRRLEELPQPEAPDPHSTPELISDVAGESDTDFDELASSGESVVPPSATGAIRYNLRPRPRKHAQARAEARATAASPGRRTRRVSIFRTEAPSLALRLTEREELDNLLNVRPSLWLPRERRYLRRLSRVIANAANGSITPRDPIVLGGEGNMAGIEVV